MSADRKSVRNKEEEGGEKIDSRDWAALIGKK